MSTAAPHRPPGEVIQVELCSGRQAQGHGARLSLDRPHLIGSDASAEVVIDDPSVLPEHARLVPSREGAVLEPLPNAVITVNGTPLVSPTAIQDGDWLVLGTTAFQVRIDTGARPRPAAAPSLGTEPITFGRLADCTIQIDSPLVSREHARLEKSGDQWIIADRGSTNGTFVNGQRLSKPHALKAGDRIDIATFGFLFTGEEVRPLDAAADGRVRVEVDRLCKAVKDRTTGEPRHLLHDISFVIEPGEFVAIFGTSGSGKSTLLDALSGRRAASGGQVRYNGTELYGAFDRFRSAIGYVPQQDIVHRKIRVSRALEYTARLRLPPDTARDEISQHVARVLEQVGLADKAQLAVDTPEPLSGGQLKRVSLGVELVANPNILFLDEVTSGLDAGTDKRMMHLFADLATRYGKTVICVTHTLENIDACNLIVLLHRGRLAYFGPPAEACGYFGIAKLSDVYELLESRPADAWAAQFAASTIHAGFVAGRLQPAHPTTARVDTTMAANRTRAFDTRQAGTLLMRYVDLFRADTRNLLILFAQAPLIGLIIGLVFGNESANDVERATNYTQISFILMLSAIWFGCLNSAREVVKELPIYLRERSINLGLGAYLFSKIVPLSVLALIQCGLLLAVVESLAELPGDSLERLWTLFLAAFGATLMGLTISTLVNSNDKAVAMVPLLLIPQVILSGAVVNLGPTTELAARFSMISYWGFDAMKSTLGDAALALTGPLGSRLIRLSVDWTWSMGAMAALAAAFLIAAIVGLKLKDRRA